jgi:hypothetical protein
MENNKEKSFKEIFGLKFDNSGKWTAEDIGNTPVVPKANRKQRRIAKAILRRAKKKAK